MKRTICAVLLLSLLSIGIVGCARDESSTKTETVTTTPGGKTTTTIERDIKQTGDNPPPARP